MVAKPSSTRVAPKAASAWPSEALAASLDDERPCRFLWRNTDCVVIGRLLRSADFVRVLRTRTQASSVHFAVHHLADRPSRPAKYVSASLISDASSALGGELSTPADASELRPVDDLTVTPESEALITDLTSVWLGAVVPKRHARRSVTRTLLKRQIRSVVTGQSSTLGDGLWVVRLRAPFDRAKYPSAASDELKRVARAELEQVLASAIERMARR